jgi:two-component system OmpR family response regulator
MSRPSSNPSPNPSPSPTSSRGQRTARDWRRPDGTPVRVLIVDDEPTYREYLERFLVRDGLAVRTAETGSDAIRIADEFGPDLLLADWMLRCEMHGIEVGEVLRERWPELRILLMTGFPTADLEAEAARVGIDGVLEKPFGLEDLARAIEAALESQRPLPISA